MSIVASVKVYDGVVLGADSQTNLISPAGISIKTYSNANKLFGLEGKPVGILTYGIGNLGKRSIENLLVEFSNSLLSDKSVDVKKIAEKLLEYFTKVYDETFAKIDPSKRQQLGFVIAGYSDDKPLAEEWEFVLPQAKEVKFLKTNDDLGASWRGFYVPFSRLAQGYDLRIEGLMKQAGITEEQIGKLKNLIPQLILPMQFNGMPLQDAVDYCRYIIDTTINTSRFMDGAQACGGNIDIAIITRKDKEIRWISQKNLA